MSPDDSIDIATEAFALADGSCVVFRGAGRIPTPPSGVYAITVFNFDVELSSALYSAIVVVFTCLSRRLETHLLPAGCISHMARAILLP